MRIDYWRVIRRKQSRTRDAFSEVTWRLNRHVFLHSFFSTYAGAAEQMDKLYLLYRETQIYSISKTDATGTFLPFYYFVIIRDCNDNFTGWATRAWTLLGDDTILVTAGLAAIASLSIGTSGHHGGSLGRHWQGWLRSPLHRRQGLLHRLLAHL